MNSTWRLIRLTANADTNFNSAVRLMIGVLAGLIGGVYVVNPLDVSYSITATSLAKLWMLVNIFFGTRVAMRMVSSMKGSESLCWPRYSALIPRALTWSALELNAGFLVVLLAFTLYRGEGASSISVFFSSVSLFLLCGAIILCVRLQIRSELAGCYIATWFWANSSSKVTDVIQKSPQLSLSIALMVVLVLFLSWRGRTSHRGIVGRGTLANSPSSISSEFKSNVHRPVLFAWLCGKWRWTLRRGPKIQLFGIRAAERLGMLLSFKQEPWLWILCLSAGISLWTCRQHAADLARTLVAIIAIGSIVPVIANLLIQIGDYPLYLPHSRKLHFRLEITFSILETVAALVNGLLCGVLAVVVAKVMGVQLVYLMEIGRPLLKVFEFLIFFIPIAQVVNTVFPFRDVESGLFLGSVCALGMAGAIVHFVRSLGLEFPVALILWSGMIAVRRHYWMHYDLKPRSLATKKTVAN